MMGAPLLLAQGGSPSDSDRNNDGKKKQPATVANGLVYFKGEWLLYYDAADRHIGLATCRSATEHGNVSAKLK